MRIAAGVVREGVARPESRHRRRRASRRGRARSGGRGRRASGMVSSLSRGSAIARPPCHRPPDEALHEVPSDRPGRRCRRQGRVQRGHRLPHRAGPAAALAKEAPPRERRRPDPLAEVFDGEVVPMLRGGARAAAGRHLRGDAAPPSRARRRGAADAGAAHPRLARAARPGAGGDLPPGPRAGPDGSVGLHRHGRSRPSPSPAQPLDHRLYHFRLAYSRLRACPCHPGRRELSWRSPRGCRTRSGRSAARRWSIAATACRPRSATSARRPRRT